MAIAITPYTAKWTPAVRAFNQRLADGGVPPEFRFPESHVPEWLPKVEGRRLYQEFYLAVAGEEVRGAFILKFQDFWAGGELRPIAYYHLPISEGIVNRAHSSVGVHMLRSAMKAQPLLFCLGMGGFDRALPQMLKTVGWHLEAVPFFFKVNHAARFLRQIAPLRRTAGHRMVSALAAFSGAGWAAVNVLQRRRQKRADARVSAESFEAFGSWADELWEQTRTRYSLIAARDRANLTVLYPQHKNFIRLLVRRNGQIVGWAVALDTPMRDNKYFGNLRLGSIVDSLAAPEDAEAVIQAATKYLEERGVDLIVCNHAHAAWTGALTAAGFLAGPSNFIYAESKPLHALGAAAEAYMMRGDGDGPVNL